MTELLIRDLDDETTQQLRALADRHGRSLEAEARALIEAALRSGLPAAPVKSVGQQLREIFEPLGGVDLPDVRDRTPHEPIRFE